MVTAYDEGGFKITNAAFISNSASDGGAIVSEGNNFEMYESSLVNNSASNGGGILIDGNNSKIDDTSFRNNSADTGGAVYWKGYDGDITASSFEGENVIYVSKNTTLTLTNNSEVGSGAKGYMILNDGVLTVDDNNFTNEIINNGNITSKDDNITVIYPSQVTVTADTITVGETAVIKVSVNSTDNTLTGNVTVKVANKDYIINLVNNAASQSINGLPAGNYTVSVIYNGDTTHESAKSNSTLTVLKKSGYSFTSTVNGKYESENITITVSLPADATGSITATFNGRQYSASLNNGAGVIDLGDNLNVGNYTVNISYSGDNKYASSICTSTFSVEKDTNPIIIAPSITKYVKGSERLQVNVGDYKGNPIANAKVNITINGVTYTRTSDDNGTVSMALGLNSGNYTATVTLIGSDDYISKTVNTTVVILPTISGENITKVYRNATQYYATFKDTNGNLLINRQVTFNINGVFYNRTTNASGVARLNINLEQGEYILTATNPVNGEMYTNIITVLATIADNTDLVKYYKNESQYVVKLIGSDGKPVKAGETVTFNINGVFYNRTANATGHAKLNINLPAGNYVITAEYNGCKVSNNISVLPILTAGDLVMNYHDGSKFKVKLVNGQGKADVGKPVTFNVNGVFYNRVTNDEGVAELNINLMAGEYIITSSYNNFNIANTITING